MYFHRFVALRQICLLARKHYCVCCFHLRTLFIFGFLLLLSAIARSRYSAAQGEQKDCESGKEPSGTKRNWTSEQGEVHDFQTPHIVLFSNLLNCKNVYISFRKLLKIKTVNLYYSTCVRLVIVIALFHDHIKNILDFLMYFCTNVNVLSFVAFKKTHLNINLNCNKIFTVKQCRLKWHCGIVF